MVGKDSIGTRMYCEEFDCERYAKKFLRAVPSNANDKTEYLALCRICFNRSFNKSTYFSDTEIDKMEYRKHKPKK